MARQRGHCRVERRCAFGLAEDQRLDARAVRCRTEHSGQLRVADQTSRLGARGAHPVRQPPPQLGVTSGGTNKLEEEQCELAVERHLLRGRTSFRCPRLDKPAGDVLIEEGEQKALLGFKVVVERALRAAGALTDEIE